MDTVSFTRMDEGTVEDYALLGKLEHEYVASLPDRLLRALEGLRNSLAGYKIDRLNIRCSQPPAPKRKVPTSR